ncbi:MAG: hypothetical protein K8I03_01720 [Ignavibacteria bacterium]|nr:hypothetical protein [Ignavibacteria bacterium]
MRNFIFISSGILFILIAAGLVITGSGEKGQFLIIIYAMAIPFLYTGVWNLLQVYYESRSDSSNSEYFTYSSRGQYGIGAFYSKLVVVPVFTIMFGTVSLAIGAALLASNRSTEDISIALAAFSFVFALTITVIFIRRINKKIKNRKVN